MNVKPRIDADEIRVPAHLSGYVDVLGLDGAVDFLLKFGGGVSYFSADPKPGTPVAEAIGTDLAAALAAKIGTGSMRVPTGKPFIARVWRVTKKMKASAIARRLHVTDTAVRNWIGPEDGFQLPLFADLPPPIDRQP